MIKHIPVLLFLLSTALTAGNAPSTVALTSAISEYPIGEPVALTVTVTPSDATGSVEFLDGVSVIGRSAVANGQSFLAASDLPAGRRTLQARYTGDAFYAPGTAPPIAVTITSGQSVGLATPASFSLPNLTAIATGDFNRDGKEDLVLTSIAGVNVLLGNGDGTFQTPVAYGTQRSTTVTVQDFDGDGIPDLAVGNANSTLSIFHGIGDGTFEIGASYATGNSPYTVCVMDVNGDGVGDLAVFYAQFGPSAGGVNLMLGNPDGTFHQATNVTDPAAGEAIGAMVAGDFDSSGTTDLILFRRDNSSVVLLRGNGDGTFQNEVAIGRVDNILTAIAADLNGDGILDLIAGDGGGGEGAPGFPPEAYNLHVLLGTGNGAFANPVSYAVTSDFAEVAADFNGDGKLDVATADADSGTVNVLLGIGDGSLDSSTVYSLPVSLTMALATGDFNSDGIADLIAGSPVSGSNLSVLTGQAPSNSYLFTDVPPSAYYFAAVGDVYMSGVTDGCTPTQYCPESSTLRWEAAVLVVRSVLGTGNFVSSPIPYFADVPAGAPGFVWIQKLYELGITSGCGTDAFGQPLFCPNKALTRAEAAVLTIRARFGPTTPFAFPAQPYFSDVPAGAFGFADIQRLKFDNITSGCQADSFCPTEEIPRKDLALFLDRGEFNKQIPVSAPVISEVSPSVLPRGDTGTFYIAGRGTHFVQGTTELVFSTASGVTVSLLTVNSPSYLTVTLSAQSDAAAIPVTIYVKTGSEEAVLPNRLVIQ